MAQNILDNTIKGVLAATTLAALSYSFSYFFCDVDCVKVNDSINGPCNYLIALLSALFLVVFALVWIFYLLYFEKEESTKHYKMYVSFLIIFLISSVFILGFLVHDKLKQNLQEKICLLEKENEVLIFKIDSLQENPLLEEEAKVLVSQNDSLQKIIEKLCPCIPCPECSEFTLGRIRFYDEEVKDYMPLSNVILVFEGNKLATTNEYGIYKFPTKEEECGRIVMIQCIKEGFKNDKASIQLCGNENTNEYELTPIN